MLALNLASTNDNIAKGDECFAATATAVQHNVLVGSLYLRRELLLVRLFEWENFSSAERFTPCLLLR